MTGSIMFSILETRPDISFATSVASRFAKNPGHQHTEAVKTILRYLKGSRERGITYGGQDKLLVEGYSESDRAGDKDDWKSTSGFIFMLNGGPVSWCSKKQRTVALSSTWSRVYSSDSGRKRGNVAPTIAHKTGTSPTRSTTHLDQGFRTKLERSRHPRRSRQPWHNAWGGRRRDCHPTKRRQPGVDSFSPQPSLPLQDQTYQYSASLHPWRGSFKENRTLVRLDRPDDCRRPYKGSDSRQVTSIHRANKHGLEHQSSV